MPPIEYLQYHPAMLIGAAGLLGLVLGSFLNVVIHRLPRMLEREWHEQCRQLRGQPNDPGDEAPFNLMVPRSRCPDCGHPISALENIPVLSYLLLRGRCSACGTRISARYPLIELLTAVLSAAVAWRFGPTWQTLAALALTWALISLSMIDLEHQILPDNITLPFLWLGLTLSLFGLFTDTRSSIIGALAGYLSLWTVYKLFKAATGKEGMGYGDFKLLALLGAWLGWRSVPLIILLSSVVGAGVGIAMLAGGRHTRSQPIPFGPYLAAAGWLALLFGAPILDAYWRWLTLH
ncbi:type 4 prepilin-like proteins leader peptide-processing enzyme [bacterium BMS3Bbin12]|nr:type 4 prepilin-like proteins leader peptide-processing enzyme [bacterium BMS3Abin12]GBE48547.1 type 4 prepilin-like proteins leader peptide-processing enzyme [bacterium BMS3Bbin12]GBE51535.1 type 4 prepilin-like proteins leader peptide-processing enzyme [bacterium BMS3Bbin13]HDK02774.1 prepilin peptidase [Gammaproteobacteria bacterium]